MGFVIVEYHVLLTRNQVIKLLLDNEGIEAITVDREKVVLMGAGKVELLADSLNGGVAHQIRTIVKFVDHGNTLRWSNLTLTTKDKQAYDVVITPIYPSFQDA